MAAVAVDSLLQNPTLLLRPNSKVLLKPSRSFDCSRNWNTLHSRSSCFCTFKPRPTSHVLSATSSETALVDSFDTSSSDDVVYEETFPVKRIEKVEGKIFIRLDQSKNQRDWQLKVGCNLPGKWILHWGVSYLGDSGSEWDQPPKNMRPPGSIPVRDYAIDTPLKKPSKGDMFHEVKIDFNPTSEIAAIHFVLKDDETRACYQHRGRDFKVPLVDYLEDDGNTVGAKKGFGIWSGALQQFSNVLHKAEASPAGSPNNNNESKDSKNKNSPLEGFYEEQPIVKEVSVGNLVSVVVRKSPEIEKLVLYLETDIPGDVVVHWGVCRDDAKRWEIPAAPYPPETTLFKNKALRTLLQPKATGNKSGALFTLNEEVFGFLFVLKLDGNTWLKFKENDFYVPLSGASSVLGQHGQYESTSEDISSKSFTDGIINEIRNLVSGLSAEKSQKTQTKEAQESILQEIEQLAAEAYSIFRSSIATYPEEDVLKTDIDTTKPAVKISSGTGTGFEILCQGFNWESHKSGRWYMELKEKASEISSLGFTVIWLPPPTESVSPEGYMPKDLYNLNSRYGTIDELKELVKSLHEAGLKVLGDVVLNHRCAHFKNQNGIWNIFGGRLNWDDRAVVCDDPHFQGRGNKSSGDSFHAAPNIDHSQDFVRKDIKEWLGWLRQEIGYDGWRLDFVRGFWGGYVKDYLDASEPYFAVGEYWDSLSYTYGEMDHNQDPHRQRIIDWINATNGTAGAFDVTTKGILHSALERCEYWRLSDQKGKPPGVVGWWPSRAVTFIENHDTGSTQGHWRFPGGKEMQGYAYILTHPGTPAVFYDHIFSHYRSEIAALISIRNRNQIHCRSTIKIVKAERDVYAAIMDEKVVTKIGPGYYEPPSGPQRWSVALEGKDYKVLSETISDNLNSKATKLDFTTTMELVTAKSELNPGRTLSFMVEGDAIDIKCIKRRRRDHSNGALGCNNQQQQPQPAATTVKRSSRFRGVSRHQWTGRFEAHLWDKTSWNPTQRKKGKQGAYKEEESAARAYDLAAIKYWGTSTFTNFPVTDYHQEIEIMRNMTKEEYLASLRRRSSGFSRGVSRYRGVARHHHNGRWEARIGRVFGNKYLYLGTYSTQEEAAHAYDIAAIEYRGINAVTNFDLSTYIRWLKPGANDALVSHQIKTTSALKPTTTSNFFPTENTSSLPLFNSNALTAEPIEIRKKAIGSHCPSSSSSPSTALSLLLRSLMFNKLMEQNLNADYSENEETDIKEVAEVEVDNVPFMCSNNRAVLSGLESEDSKVSLHDTTGKSMWNGALNLLT
ncbi:hypothetical protein V6N13_029465 [Hibiscus sabdariffa]|uniref:alpha-amylase n=1 Tax=Hibiscus sabdariffa TaxID=183260 RepID=A0ABR2TAV6_9ROSI